MPVPLTLKVFKGDTLVTAKDFERDIIKIGRLASAHLCLEDEKVSRIHSVIEVAADGSLSIIDMGSVEGTYVNGKRVNKGQLVFGDEIKVGGTTIRLENPAAVAAVNLATAAATVAPAAAAVAPAPERPLAAGLAQAATPAPTVTPAPVAVAPQPVAAPAPAPVQKAAPQPVAAPVAHAEAPAAEPVPRVRRVARKGSGPLGLGLHFMWGDQRVGEFFLPPGKKQSFTVGSAKGVNFIMGDAKLGGERFEVVRTDGQSFTVLFTGKMKGELTRKGETMDLKAVIESGKANHEGEAYALTLKDDDFISVDLGGVTLEALYESVPKKAFAPLGESVDFTVLNIFLLTFFLGAMFVIAAANHAAAGDEYADELAGTNARIAKLIVKPPETQKNKFLEKLNQQKAEKQAEKQAKKKDDGQTKKEVVKQATPNSNQAKPDKKAVAKNMAAKIFGGKGGAASLFGGGGLGGDLKGAMGNMFGAKVGAGGGFGGLGLRGGSGGGAGGGETIGIGAVGTKGRGGGMGGYGSGVGGLGGKQSVEVGIAAEDATVSGSLDKELIRQVIQRNKGQIRFCYESLLNRYPKLGGKVSIRFTIASEGNVVTSSVAQSTAGNSELEQCVAGRVRTWSFPKPKGGGSVVVTYPFLFKAAGE
ncbi:adventurous gliding motility protein GltG [Archangium violaceum]|uniref:adventurous gliding motility protein GltG n=1 Tax=Archangium violaceum TaxID=83451 RepID=UPI00194FB624|nr:adventurous gliding motility protein GltG [Archangium violaceum]QRO00985.1 adventurous gliding motility protein GltG [Archangium violaceum]